MDNIGKLLRKQAALAAFGSFALREADLSVILNEAARICAQCLDVPYAKVCQYRPAENDLLIVAGYGWRSNFVGQVVSRADETSPQGRAFITAKPVISAILVEANFALPPFYAEHGIVSTVDVIIKGSSGAPYGVLEMDSVEHHEFNENDVDFLTGFANVLAEAVATSERTEVLRATLQRMTELVTEKDALLEEKNVLAEEVQHRVRNNLQLVYGMLVNELDHGKGEDGKEGIKGIARRVMTLAKVYDHLLGTGMRRTIDFSEYLKALCEGLAELQGPASDTIRLTCSAEPFLLPLDSVTALGIIAAELVSNAYNHAFPGGTGTITVTLKCEGGKDGELRVSDDGVGFESDGSSTRRGLGLTRRLVEQIEGTVELFRESGTRWNVTFPIVEAA